jgi:diamine N-acetyltransferase
LNKSISLKVVDRNNWVDCVKLSLLPEQEKFVAPNSDTIAESKFELHHRVRAVYNQSEVVGLISYCHEEDPVDLEEFWIFRFMIDKRSQGKGYGRQALELVIAEIVSLGGKTVKTMHKPNNIGASSLYRSLGFNATGYLDDGDVLLELSLVSISD